MRNQVTPHRPKREEARAHELSDLKRENNKLKRGLKRLEKEISKRTTVEEEAAETGLQEESMRAKPSQCRECDGGPVKEWVLHGKVYEICLSCHRRKQIGAV